MRIAFGLALMAISLYYGYSLIPHPDDPVGGRGLGERTRRLPTPLQYAIAYLAWLCFTSGLWLFATRGA